MLTLRKTELVKEMVTWVAPVLVIPALRYFQEKPEQRNELFIRDASTYGFGACLFLGIQFVGRALLRKSRIPLTKPAQELAAFLVAFSANMLYAGIGAVKLSHLFAPPQRGEAVGDTFQRYNAPNAVLFQQKLQKKPSFQHFKTFR
jgi:hypothetical protein